MNQASTAAKIRAESDTVPRLKEELKALQDQRSNAQSNLTAAVDALAPKVSAFDQADQEHRTKIRKLGEQIGRWEAHGEEIKAYSASRTRKNKAERDLQELEAKIEKSEKALRKTREAQVQRLKNLSAIYSDIISQLLGQPTNGELVLDGWGIHPQPATELRINGLAMATLSTVIGFDLAAINASTTGQATLPPFLIHDSPKASDLESALYDRVYEPLLKWDQGGTEQAFQYIITTTTPPPDAAAKEPYVRLVLDGRTPDGKLLGVEF